MRTRCLSAPRGAALGAPLTPPRRLCTARFRRPRRRRRPLPTGGRGMQGIGRRGGPIPRGAGGDSVVRRASLTPARRDGARCATANADPAQQYPAPQAAGRAGRPRCVPWRRIPMAPTGRGRSDAIVRSVHVRLAASSPSSFPFPPTPPPPILWPRRPGGAARPRRRAGQPIKRPPPAAGRGIRTGDPHTDRRRVQPSRLPAVQARHIRHGVRQVGEGHPKAPRHTQDAAADHTRVPPRRGQADRPQRGRAPRKRVPPERSRQVSGHVRRHPRKGRIGRRTVSLSWAEFTRLGRALAGAGAARDAAPPRPLPQDARCACRGRRSALLCAPAPRLTPMACSRLGHACMVDDYRGTNCGGQSSCRS